MERYKTGKSQDKTYKIKMGYKKIIIEGKTWFWSKEENYLVEKEERKFRGEDSCRSEQMEIQKLNRISKDKNTGMECSWNNII